MIFSNARGKVKFWRKKFSLPRQSRCNLRDLRDLSPTFFYYKRRWRFVLGFSEAFSAARTYKPRNDIIKGKNYGRKKMGKLWESWKVYPADSDQLLRPGQRQFYVTEGAIYWHDYDRHVRRWRHNPALSYGHVYVLTGEQTGLYKNTLQLS